MPDPQQRSGPLILTRTDEPNCDGAPLYPPHAEPAAIALSLPRFIARFVRNPLTALPQDAYDEPIVTLPSVNDRIAWVTDPDLVERVLLTDAETFTKTPLDRRALSPILGSGILTSEGSVWRWQRKIAAPMFRHSEILAYVPAMCEAADRQLARWQHGASGISTEIDADMTAMTFDVISRTVLSGCGEREGEIIQEAGQEFLEPISWSIVYGMLGLPDWLWHPRRRRMLAAAKRQRDAVEALIVRRKAEVEPGSDILARLLAARHPDTGRHMSMSELVDNLTTFLAAGHETTAKALTWTLYLLARAPEWQEVIRHEVDRVTAGGPVEARHIEGLTLTTQVIKEAMRLYPPAPVLTRLAAEEVTLGPKRLSKGTLVVIPVYAVHRHRKIWSDPGRFDPRRFAPEAERGHKRAQFLPFGFGPRTCIGASFAMIEAVTLLATLIRGARFDWDGRHLPEPISRVTLRPKGGMPLTVTLL